MAISSASVGGQFTSNRPDLSGLQAGIAQRRADTMASVQPLLEQYGEAGVAAMALEGNEQAARYFRQRGMDPSALVEPVWEWADEDGNVQRTTNQAEAPEDAYQTWTSPTWDKNQNEAFRIDRAQWTREASGGAPEESPQQGTEVDRTERRIRRKDPIVQEEVVEDGGEEEVVQEEVAEEQPARTVQQTEEVEQPVADAGRQAAPQPEGKAPYIENQPSVEAGQQVLSDPLQEPEYRQSMAQFNQMVEQIAARGNMTREQAVQTLMESEARGANFPFLQALRGRHAGTTVEATGETTRTGQNPMQRVMQDYQRFLQEQQAPRGPAHPSELFRAPPAQPPRPPETQRPAGNQQQLNPDMSARPNMFAVGQEMGMSPEHPMQARMRTDEQRVAASMQMYDQALNQWRRTRMLPENDPARQQADANLEMARKRNQSVMADLGVSRIRAQLRGGEVTDIELSPEAAEVAATLDRPAIEAQTETVREFLTASGHTFDPADVGNLAAAAMESRAHGSAVYETRDSQNGKPLNIYMTNGNPHLAENDEQKRIAENIHQAVTNPESGRGQHGLKHAKQIMSREGQAIRRDIRQNPQQVEEFANEVVEYRSNDPSLNFTARMIREQPAQAAMYYEQATEQYLAALQSQAEIRQTNAAAEYNEALAGAQRARNQMSEMVTDSGRTVAEEMALAELERMRFELNRDQTLWGKIQVPALDAELDAVLAEAGAREVTAEYAKALLDMQLTVGYGRLALEQARLNGQLATASSGGGIGADMLIDILKNDTIRTEAPELYAQALNGLLGMTTPRNERGELMWDPGAYTPVRIFLGRQMDPESFFGRDDFRFTDSGTNRSTGPKIDTGLVGEFRATME